MGCSCSDQLLNKLADCVCAIFGGGLEWINNDGGGGGEAAVQGCKMGGGGGEIKGVGWGGSWWWERGRWRRRTRGCSKGQTDRATYSSSPLTTCDCSG